jgi:minimal PKS acyl carrier protein
MEATQEEAQMREFTYDDLNKIMQEAGGLAELTEEAGRTAFADLGYDSLAVLEIAARIGQQFPVHLPDEVVDRLTSPSITVTIVNDMLTSEA